MKASAALSAHFPDRDQLVRFSPDQGARIGAAEENRTPHRGTDTEHLRLVQALQQAGLHFWQGSGDGSDTLEAMAVFLEALLSHTCNADEDKVGDSSQHPNDMLSRLYLQHITATYWQLGC
jgi:hypothetical protein